MTSLQLENHQKEFEKAKDEYREQRIKAILELKENIDAASSELQGINEKKRLNDVAEQEQQLKESQDILSRGENPYEVFRRRKVEKSKNLKLKKCKAKIQEAEKKIEECINKEDIRQRKYNAIEKEARFRIEKYQKEQDRQTKEERRKNYIIKKTTLHTEILDPTGRMFRIEPSQYTTIKDNSFGLGKNTSEDSKLHKEQLIQMLKSKKEHRNVVPNAYFLPKRKLSSLNESQETNPSSAPSTSSSTSSNSSKNKTLIQLLPEDVPPGSDLFYNKLDNNESKNLKQQDNETEEHYDTKKAQNTQDNKDGNQRIIAIKKRSVLEEKYFRAALQRQKDNIIVKQIVCGKEFKGRAFLSNPEVIWFKDFTVDLPVTITIQLTNVSNSFNHFKVLPISEENKDFFQIVYEKPGRMSAGMTCLIHITFHPKRNKDIYTELPMLAKTGHFSIPIKCTIKKIIPSINMQEIRFNNVTIGEKSKVILTLINDGALDSEFEIIEDEESKESSSNCLVSSCDKNNVQEKSEYTNEEDLIHYLKANYESSMSFLSSDSTYTAFQFNSKGFLPGYNQTTISITYEPRKEEFIERFYWIKLISKEMNTRKDIPIYIYGNSVNVSIYVEQECVDFKCCFYDKLYRSKVTLRNRGKCPFKWQIQIPKELNNCIEFLPNFGYIQGINKESNSERFDIEIKFKPNKELVKNCEKYALKTKDIIIIPITILVKEQTLPAYFLLKAQLTSSDIQFSSNLVDFKSCYVGTSYTKVIQMQNLSKLTQKFGFIYLCPEISIQPHDGFGILLPNENKEIEIIYKPKAAVDLAFTLTCSTNRDRRFNINLIGSGILSPLKFSHPSVNFAAIPYGERISANVFISNVSKTIQDLEIIVPNPIKNQLKISPNVNQFSPGETKRIEIDFHPSLEYSLDNTKVKSSEGTYIQCPSLSLLKEFSKEKNSVHGFWKVPCFLKENKKKKNEINKKVEYEDDLKLQEINKFYSTAPLFLYVKTTIIEPTLITSTKLVDFGQLAVNCVKIFKLKVSNLDKEKTVLSMKPLNTCGAFEVINALRTLKGISSGNDNYQYLHIRFQPKMQEISIDTLILMSSKGSVEVKLVGEGICPTLQIEPENGILHLGHVLAGEKALGQFTIKNTSPFPLHYRIKCEDNQKYMNYNQISVFSCLPYEDLIPAGKSKDITVTFSSDHELPFEYTNTFKIHVPNQKQEHRILFKARCWERQIYLMLANSEDEYKQEEARRVEDIFYIPPSIGIPQEVNQNVSSRRIFLSFPKENKELSVTKQIIVGSLSLRDEKSSTNGAFEFSFTNTKEHVKYFTVDPIKGVTIPGKSQIVTVTFTAEESLDNTGLDVGQWIEIELMCNLKGGYFPPSQRDTESVIITLSAYIKL